MKTVLEDPTGSNILPVCLGWNSDIKIPNPQFRLSLTLGWGKNNNENFDTGDLSTCGVYTCVLKKGYVPIVPAAECARKHLRRFPIYKDQHVCAGDEGKIILTNVYFIKTTNSP